MRSKLSRLLPLLAAVALNAPAAAQDDPAPPAAETAAPAAKAERRVSPEALARLEGWGKAMHLPQQTKANRITAQASASNESLFQGGRLTVTATWDRETGLALDVKLPQEMTESMPPQAVEMARSLFETWSREALAPAFESPTQYAKDYHVTERKKGERTVVELLPFTEHAAAEMQELWFDDAGLCERRILIPKVDMNDPSQQMLVGVEIETTFGYEKVGERHVLKRMSMLLPFGEMLVEYGYYDITDGPPLLRTVTMATPFAPDPIEVALHDYLVDGSGVPATKRAEKAGDEQPAKPESPEETPSEESR